MARLRHPRDMKCKRCGASFIAIDSCEKYCSDSCRYIERERQRKINELNKKNISVVKKDKKQNNMKSITQLNREDLAHGMSYGQYVLYLQENKNAKI